MNNKKELQQLTDRLVLDVILLAIEEGIDINQFPLPYRALGEEAQLGIRALCELCNNLKKIESEDERKKLIAQNFQGFRVLFDLPTLPGQDFTPERAVQRRNSLKTHINDICFGLSDPNSRENNLDCFVMCAAIVGRVKVVEDLVLARGYTIPGYLGIKLRLIANDFDQDEIKKFLEKNGVTSPTLETRRWETARIIQTLDPSIERPYEKNVGFIEMHGIPKEKISDEEQAIQDALKRNDPRGLESLLDTPQKISIARTLVDLNWLAKHKAIAIVKILYPEGQDKTGKPVKHLPSPSQADRLTEGNAPLHKAVLNNDIEMVKFLTSIPGIQYDQQDFRGRTPFSLCLEKNDIKDEIIALIAARTEQKQLFDKKLFDLAILSGNFLLIRIIYQRTPHLLPDQHYRVSNEAEFILGLMQSSLNDIGYKEFLSVWNFSTHQDFKSMLDTLYGHFFEHSPIKTRYIFEVTNALKLGDLSSTLNYFIAMYRADLERKNPHVNQEDAKLFSFIRFAVIKYIIIQTALNISLGSEKNPEILTRILSESDRRLLKNEIDSCEKQMRTTNGDNPRDGAHVDQVHENDEDNNNTPHQGL